MTIPSTAGFFVLYVLIFLSGCAGLIYQVVWHKYLAILLGAQARATAIVLAIFLGGISVGYLCFGRWSRWKRWNLFMAYAAVELGLGLWAFFFPYFFKVAMPMTSQMYHLFGVNSLFIDVFMSILLIGFPTFLMGGTLPLLTQALSQDLKDASRTHAKIYGINTVGACVGCLAAGYILIPVMNLPRTTMIAGVLNILVALVTYFAFAKWSNVQEVSKEDKPTPFRFKSDFSREQIAILTVGFLSGFYLITLETVLIRLMGLATGAANYNFTLIVAIFIFGLGIGSLLIRRMGEFTPSRLFWNQIIVSASLLLLYISGDYWSYGVHLIRVMFRDMYESFYVYQLFLGVSFLLVMVVPIGFSGLTLPLCFHLIKDKKETLGHRVGQLYGLNTVGCVMGAVFGGYALFSFFDLDQLFKLCIFMSLLTVGAAAYLYFPKYKPGTGQVVAASVVLALTFMGTVIAPRYNRGRWVQPFRHSSPLEATFKGADAFGTYLSRSTHFLYWKDGNNTSVGIGSSQFNGKEGSRTIFVNGKSDGNTRGDFFTTVMLGHIPALLAKKIDRTCIIGLGTGITVGTLLQYPETKVIDVAEISDVSIKNAYYFDPYNNNVSTNPKVKFHEMDAFRYLEGTSEKYDLIVSEPSNPWVAGIENLYSAEFYEIAKRKMTDDGVFVQWIHTYSFEDSLFKMVLKTMTSQFPMVSVFQLKGGDLALVAHQKAFTREDMLASSQRFHSSPAITRALAEAGIKRFETMLALELIPASLTPIIAEGSSMHTLESPKLSNEAAKAFYVGSSARVHNLRRQFKDFYSTIDKSMLAVYQGDDRLPSWDVVESHRFAFCENNGSKNSTLCEETMAIAKMVNPGYEPTEAYDNMPQRRELASLASFQFEPKGKFTALDLQEVYSMFEVYKKYASPLARMPISGFMNRVETCIKTVPSKDELHGECLLQKILVLETVRPPSMVLTSAINDYLTWFPTVDPKAPNYAKLLEAKEILTKMAAMPAATPR